MANFLPIEEIDRPLRRRSRFYDSLVLSHIRDPRDLAFADLILKASLFLLLGLILLLGKNLSLLWYIPYYLIGGFLLGPFILMLHCTSHRTLFKKEYGWLNLYIPWILSPFFGLTPETYYAHHVGMHHPENNLQDDLSSTLPYHRDRFLDFLKYFGRFFFLGLFEMPRYFWRKNRPKLGTRMLLGELSFYLMIFLLCFWNWQGVLLVFALPFFITRFMMMNGNWAQHAFVDPSNPEDNYRNSITCINSLYNRRCFNDGFHIVHHLQPTLHWQEVPSHLCSHFDLYLQKDAVIFEKIDYFVIWIFLMLKRYDWLAKYFVDLKEEKRSKQEIITLLKSRTQPILLPR